MKESIDIMVIGKLKKEEREHRFFRFMGIWKGEKNINCFKSKFHNI